MKQVPEIKIPFLKYYHLATQDPIGLRTRIFNEYGNIAYKTIKGITTYHVFHPDYIKRILSDNQNNYFNRHILTRTVFGPLFGENSLIVTNNYTQWHRDRTTAQVVFEPTVYFEDYAKNTAELTSAMIKRWNKTYQNNEYINIHREIGILILSIVSHSFMKLELNYELFFDKINIIAELIKKKLHTLPFIWRFSKSKKVYDQMYGFIYDALRETADKRKQNEIKWDDILGHFIKDYTDLSNQDAIHLLTHHLLTFYAVAFFTTPALIQSTLVELSYHPDIERKVADEIHHVLGNRLPTYKDIVSLKYLSMVIKETLRLHPSSYVILRESISSDIIDGFNIPQNSGISINTYQVHRHPDFWSNPEGFDPERFNNNPLGQSHPFAYVPFGSGDRRCPGSGFALLEATIIIAMIVQQYQLYLPPHAKVSPFISTIISMRPNISHMQLHFK